MTKKEFLKIVQTKAKNTKCNEINKRIVQNRYLKGDIRFIIDYINNMSGNCVIPNNVGDEHIRNMYHNNYFTDKEWEQLIPYIYYREFNKDFNNVIKKVVPLFKNIQEYLDDIELEIWQGIFSFNTHWAVEGKSPEKSINKPQNGKLYCRTLLMIYPIFKELIDKWNCHDALFRFTTYKYGRAILYDPKIMNK